MADVLEVLELGSFLCIESAGPRSGGELVHPLEICLFEVEAEEVMSGFRRHVIDFGLNHTLQNGRS